MIDQFEEIVENILIDLLMTEEDIVIAALMEAGLDEGKARDLLVKAGKSIKKAFVAGQMFSQREAIKMVKKDYSRLIKNGGLKKETFTRTMLFIQSKYMPALLFTHKAMAYGPGFWNQVFEKLV